jgi:hypothetical protein
MSVLIVSLGGVLSTTGGIGGGSGCLSLQEYGTTKMKRRRRNFEWRMREGQKYKQNGI